jgi:hypothetical protein
MSPMKCSGSSAMRGSISDGCRSPQCARPLWRTSQCCGAYVRRRAGDRRQRHPGRDRAGSEHCRDRPRRGRGRTGMIAVTFASMSGWRRPRPTCGRSESVPAARCPRTYPSTTSGSSRTIWQGKSQYARPPRSVLHVHRSATRTCGTERARRATPGHCRAHCAIADEYRPAHAHDR